MSSKKKNTRTAATTLSRLSIPIPNDIIIEILSWLPANSLLRLRWACKYWFDLITTDRDTDFVKLHLHRSITIHLHNTSVLISITGDRNFSPGRFYRPPCKIFQCYIDQSTTATPTVSYSAKVPILFQTFVDFKILGSCHGLILFSYHCREPQETKGGLCLWNPCTKEYKYLPNPVKYDDDSDSESDYCYRSVFGLGYDHSIDDYKIIRNVEEIHIDFDGAGIIYIEVYTLRTNSWRYIGSFTGYSFSDSRGHGVFVNEALNFIMSHIDGSNNRDIKIHLFNFEKEMYEELLNQPECLHDMANYAAASLATFEGSLCLTLCCSYTKGYIMNNNKESSWTQLYEFVNKYAHYSNNMQPLRFSKNGEIMLLDKLYGLVLCDPRNYNVRWVKENTASNKDNMLGWGDMAEAVYIESLVSLNSGTYIASEEGDNYMVYSGDEDDDDC